MTPPAHRKSTSLLELTNIPYPQAGPSSNGSNPGCGFQNKIWPLIALFRVCEERVRVQRLKGRLTTTN
jgi:hypothetical protein